MRTLLHPGDGELPGLGLAGRVHADVLRGIGIAHRQAMTLQRRLKTVRSRHLLPTGALTATVIFQTIQLSFLRPDRLHQLRTAGVRQQIDDDHDEQHDDHRAEHRRALCDHRHLFRLSY